MCGKCFFKEALGGHGLVFHSAAKWRHAMSVFFIGKRVGAKLVGKKFHEVYCFIDFIDEIWQGLRVVVDVILDEHGRCTPHRIGINTIIYVFGNSYGYQVVSNWVAVFPFVACEAIS